MKAIFPILALFIFAVQARAQSNGASANQNVVLQLSNAIALSFQSTGTATGSSVYLNFNSVSNFINGVASGAQQLKVQSNKQYNIAVSTASNYFTYSGTATPAPVMPVNGVLNLMVASNNTGGTIPTQFNGSYAGINSTPQLILSNALNNNNATFAVQYQAIPGTNYPAGAYAANVIYTATQP
jgi:hypothetical protein